MNSRFVVGLLYVIIFFTGAAGLVYQVTWQRYLSRMLGSDSIATAIILAVFLGGLSLGYFLCGKMSTRVRNHFKAYALLEGLIGAWCLFFPTLFQGVEALTSSWSFSAPFLIIVQGFICSALLMGIPTVCMGSTIPFLTRGISRNITESTGVHAKVYAINTAGAFLGTLLAGFLLIPEYGLPLTIMGAAFVNLAAFLSIYFLQRWIHTEAGEQTAAEPEPTAAATLERHPSAVMPPMILYTVAFLSGFYVMTLENVLIRITNLSIGSSSYSFSLIIAVFILAIAIGSYVVGRLKTMAPQLLYFNQMGIAVSLLLLYFSLDTWPYWAYLIRTSIQSHMFGFWLYYCLIFVVLLIILFVPVGLMGATVPITFHEIKRDLKNVGKHSGYLFSLNTIGSLTGSLIGGIVFYYFLNTGRVFVVAIVLAAFSTFLAGRHLSKKYSLGAIALMATTAVLLISGTFYNQTNFAIGLFRTREPRLSTFVNPNKFIRAFGSRNTIKYYNDGPMATVAVTESTGTYRTEPQGNPAMSIFVNGKSDSNTLGDQYTLKLSAHVPALLAKNRADSLVIGLGTGVTAGELTLYPDAESIDVAEISPSVVEALPLFGKFTHNVHENPKVHFHSADAFRLLGRSEKKYDIIISEPSNPWVTGVDLLFTDEFYRLVNAHLKEGGVLLQWAQLYATDHAMVGMMINTVQQTFKHCHVFIGNRMDLLILATNEEFSKKDLERAKRLFDSNAKVKASLGMLNIEHLEAILIREIWTTSYLTKLFQDAGIQTMDNPRLHYLAGQNFFKNSLLPETYMFNPKTASHYQQFLLPRMVADWNTHSFPAEVYISVLDSLENPVNDVQLPIFGSLKMKAFMHPASGLEYSRMERMNLGIDFMPFVQNYPDNGKTWADIGLGDLSVRERANIMINLTNKYRGWIVPHSVKGLINFLQEGIQQGRDSQEKNWCALQLILLTLTEKDDYQEAIDLFKKTIKYENGELILEKRDNGLLKFVVAKLLKQN